MTHPLPRPRLAWVAAITLILCACATAPAKVERPKLRDDVPLAGLQASARNGWPDTQWWRQYGDPQLDQLMDRAMAQSPDLALAQSRLRSAEQSARLAAAKLGLTVKGNAQVARQRLSDHGFIPSQFLGFSWYNQADLGIQLQYDFDWWGKKRATVEAALDQAHAAQAQQSAAALAIQYAVADTYFSWLADHVRLKLADQLLATQQQFTHIAELRVGQGIDLPDTAQKAQVQLAQAREMQVALEGSATIRLAALASLLGVGPTEHPNLQPRPLPSVDGGVPANVSLDLIARRPDIAASRWQVESALKKTDAARAEFFPDLSISAMAGLSSIDLGKLFTYGSRTFALTPALHLPIFNGGSLQASYGVSKAQLDAAVAQYNSTILTAAREVATQALTVKQIAARSQEQHAQLLADQQLLSSAQARVRQGVRDARESLLAKAQLLQQRDTATQLQAQMLSADLNLIKALGGGYHAPERPAAHDASSSHPVTAGAADHERH
ncbi:MAG: efflux transporter outer membrane subunit [Pseudomonadota bacterium]|nr:efflux transporter outer membrane subunit [Pseudomonadota bacterium]